MLAPFAPELGAAADRQRGDTARRRVRGGGRPCLDVPGTALRLWPILSEHSAQFRGSWPFKGLIPPFTLWRGEPLRPLTSPPSRAGQWPEGTTFAYLIDILEGDRTVFRIYYQDSGTRAPIGHPPDGAAEGQEGRPRARLRRRLLHDQGAHPQKLLDATRPDFVIASHWEDFFAPRTIPVPGAPPEPEKLRVLPNHSTKTFMRRVRSALEPGARASLACPGLPDAFPPEGRWLVDDRGGQRGLEPIAHP